jgi:hypothetical protein
VEAKLARFRFLKNNGLLSSSASPSTLPCPFFDPRTRTTAHTHHSTHALTQLCHTARRRLLGGGAYRTGQGHHGGVGHHRERSITHRATDPFHWCVSSSLCVSCVSCVSCDLTWCANCCQLTMQAISASSDAASTWCPMSPSSPSSSCARRTGSSFSPRTECGPRCVHNNPRVCVCVYVYVCACVRVRVRLLSQRMRSLCRARMYGAIR